jgi:hypothetical protein
MNIDALLYTNNSTWALVRSSSIYKGQLILNGGLVAVDTGVLVPGSGGGAGLQLNYDARQRNKLNIADTSGPATVRRSLWIVVSHY